MKLFGKYLKGKIGTICMFLVFAAVFMGTFALYHMPAVVIFYPMLLCLLLGLICLLVDFSRFYEKIKMLRSWDAEIDDCLQSLPKPSDLNETSYQEIIHALYESKKTQQEQIRRQNQETVEYYSTWVHQIKTPIAAMRLQLQNEDSAFSRTLLHELGRIEQYVEMVLTYLRLDSTSTDYVIKEYDLDQLVRTSVKKFSSEFIGKRLKLQYTPLKTTVLTDEKWLGFVIEQVLSNALKYTTSGSISIYLEQPKTLCIQDTGIGIAEEDLPRIFENGFTGFNGRIDKKASGIGLYLCRRICKNLGYDITAHSAVGQGTTIRIHMELQKVDTK